MEGNDSGLRAVKQDIERVDRNLREAGQRKGDNNIKSFQRKTLGAISVFYLRVFYGLTKYLSSYIFCDLCTLC